MYLATDLWRARDQRSGIVGTHNLCFEQKYEKKKKKISDFIWKLPIFGGEIFNIFE